MHRFYLPKDRLGGAELILEDQEAHHALQVLRLRPGDVAQVLDGEGVRCDCVVRSVDRRALRLEVVQREVVSSPAWQITLAQAVPKGKTMEAIVQKASELGVGCIVPLLTERTEIHFGDAAQRIQKREKWRVTAIEAIKQCGSPWLPRIQVPMRLDEWLESSPAFDLGVVGACGTPSRHPRSCWEDFRTRHGRPPLRICLVIGPEGDLSPTELDRLILADFQAVSFGPFVLRCETAAICGLAVLHHELRA